MKIKQRILAFSLSAAIAMSTAATVNASGLLGDVNSDGKINSSDALAVLQYSVGYNVKNFNKANADMNFDGKINSTDALQILKISVGLVDGGLLNSSKERLVSLYNQSIKDACKAKKVTVTKEEALVAKADKVSPNPQLKEQINAAFADDAIPQKMTETFRNGKSFSGIDAELYCIPSDLEASGASSASIAKVGDNYEITIKVVPEKMTSSTPFPKYNSQCALVFDFLEVPPIGMVESYDMAYTGTVLKAVITADGKLLSSSMYMPYTANLKVKAEKGGMVTVNMSGNYSQKAAYSYK